MPEARRARLRRYYAWGAALCVVLPLALQAALGPLLPPGRNPAGETLLQIGYTFTALSALCLALAAQRLRRAKADGPRSAWAILGASPLILSCAAFGCLYWALGGRTVERHARTFLALSPIGFLLFVPRPGTWTERAPPAG